MRVLFQPWGRRGAPSWHSWSSSSQRRSRSSRCSKTQKPLGRCSPRGQTSKVYYRTESTSAQCKRLIWHLLICLFGQRREDALRLSFRETQCKFWSLCSHSSALIVQTSALHLSLFKVQCVFVSITTSCCCEPARTVTQTSACQTTSNNTHRVSTPLRDQSLFIWPFLCNLRMSLVCD